MSQRNQKEIFKMLKRENGSTTYRNLKDATKAVLRGMFIAMNSLTIKIEKISTQFYTSRDRKRKTKPKVKK